MLNPKANNNIMIIPFTNLSKFFTTLIKIKIATEMTKIETIFAVNSLTKIPELFNCSKIKEVGLLDKSPVCLINSCTSILFVSPGSI